MRRFRLVAVSEGTHQHEIELRGDEGSTGHVLVNRDPKTGELKLYDSRVLEDLEEEDEE